MRACATRSRGARTLGVPLQRPQSGFSYAARFGRNVMVHRTDIAGSVGCRGQVKSGPEHLCRRVPNRALTESRFSETGIHSCHGGTKCSRRFMRAIPSVQAVYVDRGWPDQAPTSEHCKGRDDNAIQ
jgi:hypothetical protein